MTSEDWVAHLFLDLQPYVCTFDRCIKSHKMFDIFEGDLDMKPLFDVCRGLSVQSHPTPQRECPLCGSPYKEPTVDWIDHIASHLEQFALLAIGEDTEPQRTDHELDRNDLVDKYIDDVSARYAPKIATNEPPTTALQHNVKVAPSYDVNYTDTADDEDKVQTYLDDDQAAEKVWHNVPQRNSEFVGRDEDLITLHTYVSQPGHICVISGRGGIGKTATAIEYARRFEHNYAGIIWIEAETQGGLADKYCAMGTKIFDLKLEGLDPNSFTMRVRDLLGSWDKRWLLILDNVEAWDDVAKYYPRGLPKTKGSVLITTRKQALIQTKSAALQRVLHRVELETLRPEEGAQFLIRSIFPKLTPSGVILHEEYDLAIEIAGLVEGLPLALIMVAGYVKVSRQDLADFLEIWEEKTAFRAKKIKRNRTFTEETLDSSIDLLWDIGISELSVAARTLLEILAFLDPENIQKDLLVGDHVEDYLEFLNSTETALYRRMITVLYGRKLIEIRFNEQGAESYRIHRLLQKKIVFDIAPQLKLDSAMAKATRLVRKRFPEAPVIQASAPQNWKAAKEYQGHCFSLLRAFQQAKDEWPEFEQLEEMADLFYDAGFYMWDRQATDGNGLEFLDAAESIHDSEYIKTDPMSAKRANIHCMSGLLRNAMGCMERDESFKRLQQALKIRSFIYDNDASYNRDNDILLQNAANDYGILLLNQYRFQEAGAIFEKCLKRYRVWGTEEEIPFEYSKYYYNMGIVRMWQENLDEGISFFRKSTKLAKAAFGKGSQFWDNYFMMACAVRHSGDHERALKMHLKALNARLEQQGQHSKGAILSTFAVGKMHATLGNLPTAIEYLERCIDLAMASTSWTEEALGRARLRLARTYRRHDVKLVEAEGLEKKAMAALETYSSYAADWVAGINEPIMTFDDLQPTDEGRYTGTTLLRVLWARRTGRKTATFFCELEDKVVTINTGL
ncbi:hypothetical protein OQA88_5075 [Cercophora sp. LCS_1]